MEFTVKEAGVGDANKGEEEEDELEGGWTSQAHGLRSARDADHDDRISRFSGQLRAVIE